MQGKSQNWCQRPYGVSDMREKCNKFKSFYITTVNCTSIWRYVVTNVKRTSLEKPFIPLLKTWSKLT